MNEEGKNSELTPGTSENGKNVAADTVKEGSKKAVNSFGKKVTDKLLKKGAASAAKHSIAAALGPIIFWVVVVIVALIIIIGILMFFITMPGMVMEQLKELFRRVGDYIAACFGADTTAQIRDVEVYETLDYLEQMGWELKGEGFLTSYATDTDLENAKNDSDLDAERRKGATLDEDVGVVRDSDDKIIKAYSDFIFTYMMSDNYCYTLKNDNVTTQRNLDQKNWLAKLVTAGVTMWARLENFVYGPIFDAIGLTEGATDVFGKGLIVLYYDSEVGTKEKIVNMGSFWNWDSIKVDTKQKTLSISRNELFNSNNPIKFSLDGWTGRYGMPLEFLLAIHKSTMMPDLAYDMVKTFPTNVNVYLHDISGNVVAAYKTGDGKYIPLSELNDNLNNMQGRNFFSKIITWFDNLSINDKEAQIAFQMGVDHAKNCSCTKEAAKTVYAYSGYVLNGEKDNYTSVTLGENQYNLTKNGDSYTASFEIDGQKTDLAFSNSDVTEEVSDIETYSFICKECSDHVQHIMALLHDPDDYDFQAYSPYIYSVTNHWYRDVDFIIDSSSSVGYVDYDYDYEALTKERWSLYETDKNGDFKYYEVDADGNYKDTSKSYTREEADKKNLKVIKKAKTVNLSDSKTRDDLGWNSLENGKWGAYKEDTTDSSTGYEPAYTQEQIDAETNEDKKQVMGNIYANVTTNGNVVQTGEGMRRQTNSDIKKMFLENTYFRYDGNDNIAEAITQLRDKYNMKYGSISSSYLDGKHTTTVDGQTYKIEDVSGNVSLNQDSLNAFSILENEHTLDADYIYRDFKELIVELGYFEKEELTDETPRVMEFIVPDINSALYPRKSIDKNEHEFGTMLHSKGDIQANEMNIVKALEENAEESIDAGGFTNEPTTSTPSVKDKIKSIDEINTSTSSNLSVVKAIDFTKESATSPDGGYNTTTTVNGITYKDYKQGNYSDTQNYTVNDSGPISSHGCSVSSSAILLSGYGIDKTPVELATLMGWSLGSNDRVASVALTQSGVEAEWFGVSGAAAEEKIKQASSEGKPVIALMGTGGSVKWTGGGHFVTILAVKEDGTPLVSDPGHRDEQHNEACPEQLSEMCQYMKGIAVPLEAPDGFTKSNDGVYQGYEGNEAVVSPVTGVLLEYGEYDPDDEKQVDSITGLGYRVNTDLRYGPVMEPEGDKQAIIETPTGANGTTVSTPTTQQEGEIQLDKVGYAKILVLDEENYEKFEKNIKDSTVFKGKDSFLSETGNYRDYNSIIDGDLNEDAIEKWETIDYTLYAYKEFAEIYKEAGISGNIIYIDGFKPELPDTKLSGGDEGTGTTGSDDKKEMCEQLPKGDEIKNKEYFQKITLSNINSEEQLESRYEKDDEYKTASKKATEKLNTETEIKAAASASYYFKSGNKEITLIKEGTVIGRTITDKELITSIRELDETDYENYRPKKEDKKTSDEEEVLDKVMGNYLRIQMKDKDDTEVEDIENYMKLDEIGEDSNMSVSQEYKAWEGDLEILAEGMYLEGSYGYLAALSNKFKNDQKEADFEMYCHGYSMVNKLLEQNKQWYGHLYDSSRTDKSPLAQVLTSKWYAVRDKVQAFIDGGPSHYTDKELAYAEYCLKYDCTSQTKPYESPLGGAATADGYSATPAGSKIPRAQCQQGGYGDGASGQSNIILVGYWDHNNNEQFDKGDELWGVDRSMESLIE